MQVIAIINPKGGVGKSTLATNIAGYWASQGYITALGDLDPQQSSHSWLHFRPDNVNAIMKWTIDDPYKIKTPKSCTHAVLDTPAGLNDKALKAVLKQADKVLLPLQPSVFDMFATRTFLEELESYKKIDKIDVALLGMRTKEHALSVQRLHQFCAGLSFAILGTLRDTQNYIHLAAQGLTLFDVSPAQMQRDLEQWQPICDWLDGAMDSFPTGNATNAPGSGAWY